ncbi:MAG TPA: PqqD family protein [Patescibacteria group bacterium]|nr:PqqD family protein [Patescibacteria group bacterium]
MITLSSVVRQNQKIITKVVGGKVYLLDPETVTVRTLNSVAGYLWQLLKKPVSVRALVSRITEEFDVETKTAKSDILEFLNHYRDHDLIRAGGRRPSSKKRRRS